MVREQRQLVDNIFFFFFKQSSTFVDYSVFCGDCEVSNKRNTINFVDLYRLMMEWYSVESTFVKER